MIKEVMDLKGKCIYSQTKLESLIKALNEEGIKYKDEYVICNKRVQTKKLQLGNHKVLSVNMLYANDLIMYDVCVYAKGRRLYLSIEEIDSEDSFASGEKYTLLEEDDVPEVGLSNEELVSYELIMDRPYFGELIGENTNLSDFTMEVASALVEFDTEDKDFASLVVNNWSYKLEMLNNDIYKAIFVYNTVDVKKLLTSLRDLGYKFKSLGLRDVRFISGCIASCGFVSRDFGVVYISVYYSNLEERYLLRIDTYEEERNCLLIEGKEVWMQIVDTNDEDLSTFIKGFDFFEFREFNLV